MTKKANQIPELTVHRASFIQADMVDQPSPGKSHTSDFFFLFFFLCNFDLPSVLTWHVAGLISTRSCHRVPYHVPERGSPFSAYKAGDTDSEVSPEGSTAVQYPVPFSTLHPV